MQASHKQAVFNIIKELTKLPKESIIMNYNNKAKPTGDFITIHFGQISSDEGDEYLDEEGEPIIFFDEEVIIDAYTKKEKDCKLLLQRIKKFIRLEKIQSILNEDNLTYVESGNIFDLSEILTDKANTIQYRAQIILTFRYFVDNDLSEDDECDIINSVEGETNLPFGNYYVERKEE